MQSKYYEIWYCDDLKIVGRCPQVEGFIKGYDPMSEFGIFKIPLFELPSFIPNLDGIKLYKKAKLTDYIYSGGMFFRGQIIHDRVSQIYKKYNFCKNIIYRAKLYQQNKVLEDYRVILSELDILQYIDYNKTEFYSYHGPSVKYLEKINVSDAESYLKISFDLIHGPEGTYVYSLQHKYPIYLTSLFPKELDYFTARFFAYPIISERLKNALEENKVTGVWFKELGDKLIFQ